MRGSNDHENAGKTGPVVGNYGDVLSDFYPWETVNRTACLFFEPGRTYDEALLNLKPHGLEVNMKSGGFSLDQKWLALVESHASLSGYACEIRGMRSVIAGGRIITGSQITS